MKLFEPFIVSIIIFCWIILLRKMNSDFRIQKADLKTKHDLIEKFINLQDELIDIQRELIDKSEKFLALRDLYCIESEIIMEKWAIFHQEIKNKKFQNEMDISERIKVCKSFIVVLDEWIANPDKYCKKKNTEILTVEKHGNC